MTRKSWMALWRRLPSRTWRILRSNRVSMRDKLLLIVPVALYWILPDFMPFIPIDDAAFTAIAASWFVKSMERKYRLADSKRNVA